MTKETKGTRQNSKEYLVQLHQGLRMHRSVSTSYLCIYCFCLFFEAFAQVACFPELVQITLVPKRKLVIIVGVWPTHFTRRCMDALLLPRQQFWSMEVICGIKKMNNLQFGFDALITNSATNSSHCNDVWLVRDTDTKSCWKPGSQNQLLWWSESIVITANLFSSV